MLKFHYVCVCFGRFSFFAVVVVLLLFILSVSSRPTVHYREAREKKKKGLEIRDAFIKYSPINRLYLFEHDKYIYTHERCDAFHSIPKSIMQHNDGARIK